ncbi:MAG: RHS repeat-associated core domain-containing protein [Candidatus Kapaibacterium sp.]|nr:MAG: RHS repeat-associated core domain-containing protein [Candidatus Kapabacteria bacterium]
MIRREGQGSVKRKDYGFAVNTSLERSDRARLKCIHMPSLSPTFLYNGDFVPGIREELSSWAWNSRRASGASDTAMASVYHYDLLNRIRTDSTRLRGATAWSAVGSHWQSSYTYDGNGNIQTLYRANATGSQMDNLTYAYTSGTNKLINISDYQGASTGADIGDQDGNNYAYDATGNMTQDTAAGIEAGGIVWSPYNKIKSITKMGDDTTSKLVYHYDATGNRILKRYYKPYNTLKSTTWYVRDAQGNTLATYTKPADSSTARQHEVMLYGSTRLAVAETQAPYSDSETDTLGIFDRVSSRTLGTKRYELTDHLGNVRATVTDVVIDHGGDLDAELSTRTDYYPFGMIMGGRNTSAGDVHRYGFNGKENDNEVKGEGVQQDYGFRIYDARVARFLSVDPLSEEFSWNSTYSFAENDVIRAVDIDGREKCIVILTSTKDGRTKSKTITDKTAVQALWKGLSTVDNLNWTQGEWMYRQYTDGYNTYPYYPRVLENVGALIIDQRLGVNSISYVGWAADIKALNEETNKKQRDQFLRQPGQAMQYAGVGLQATAALGTAASAGTLAPITLPLFAIGHGISLLGSSMEIGSDLFDGNYEDAFVNMGITIASEVVTGFTSAGLRAALRGSSVESWMKATITQLVNTPIEMGGAAVQNAATGQRVNGGGENNIESPDGEHGEVADEQQHESNR